MTLTISVERVTRWLTLAVAAVVLAGIGGYISKHGFGHDRLLGLVRLFDLNGEGNVPAWFSSALLLVAAGLLALIAHARREIGAPYALHWAGLALIFLALSLDETASIHEMAGRVLRPALRASGVLAFTWVIPGGAVVAFLGLVYLRFVNRLPPETRRLVVLAGGLYVGGVLGLELVGSYLAYRWGEDSLAFLAEVVVEETMEMAGAVVFIRALLGYLATDVGEVRLTVETAEHARTSRRL
jgi:hypothetical protein